MFWSTPKLPIEPQEQQWIEQSMLWMLDRFGRDYFLSKPTVLPQRSFFPDSYRGTEQCVHVLVKRICGYMDVEFSKLQIQLFDGENYADDDDLAAGESRFEGPAGLFSQTRPGGRMSIQIHTNCLQNSTKLVATIAHELSHARLLGDRHLSAKQPDHELLTDLFTVFLGLGILTANAAFQFHQWQDGTHQGWNISRGGYMSEAQFGYALAAYCWMRGETKPAWSELLAINVQHHFRKSLKYLNQRGGTVLSPLR